MAAQPSALRDRVPETYLPARGELQEYLVRLLPPESYVPVWSARTPHDPPEPKAESSRPAEHVAQTPSAEQTAGYAGYVLAVDDESAIRSALHDLLEDEGYQVFEAADGVEALTALRATSERYVVLLDYLMPNMNGLEVLRAVVADPILARQHAFILISANLFSLQDELKILLTQNGIPLISKPFHWSTLLQAVEEAARRLSIS